MSTGGSIESISVGGRIFAVAADADASIKLGGFENEVQANGNGTSRTIKTAVPWSVTGVSLSINDATNDQDYLQAVADSLDNIDIVITMASGAVFSGFGTITGELTMSSQSATSSLEFSGPGKLDRQ